MDILQQSLQAADILSGDDNDDLFGELGLTFNNAASESVELPNELEELASQADSLYNSGGMDMGKLSAAQSNYMDYNSGGDLSSTSQFDTSQFLNTAASVNLDIAPGTSSLSPHNFQCHQQNNSQVLASSPYTSSMYLSPSQSLGISSQYAIPQQQDSTYTTSLYQTHPVPQSSVHSRAVYMTPQTSHSRGSTPTPLQSSSHFIGNTYSGTTTSVAHSLTAATCSSVFSRLPTQAVSTTAKMSATSTSMLPAGIRVVSQNAYQPVSNISNTTSQPSNSQVIIIPDSETTITKASTSFQLLQQQNAAQNTRQLIAVVQKPNVLSTPVSGNQQSSHVINGLAVQQQQANLLQGNRSVAVLRVAGGKHINISDPQVVKALTANLQKQQIELQSSQQSQQQFIKLGQNNSFINVTSRPSQQQQQQNQTSVQKPQQITLQNGQTFLLNNGQQVQLCAQSQPGQTQQVLQQQQSTMQNLVSAIGNNRQVLRNIQQTSRNGQLPIKGIQIASVNIPRASSTSTTSVNSGNGIVQSSTVMNVPAQAKQDLARTMITASADNSGQVQVGTTPAKQVIQIQQQNSTMLHNLATNSASKQAVATGITNVATYQDQTIATPQQSSANGQVANNNSTMQRAQQGPTLRLNLTPQQASQLTPSQLQTILKQHQAALQARALAANANKAAEAKSVEVVTQVQNTPPEVGGQQKQMVQQNVPASSSLVNILRSSSTASVVTPIGNSVVVNKPEQSSVQVFRIDPTLTEAQADEVKKLLANRTIGSKIGSLTREQQQFVFAFQAQIKTMSSPVQQYYLRNPQLFMQKVMQQIRLGKPFILQVRTDAQQNKSKVLVPTVTPSKPAHPTISLTQDTTRVKKVGTPTQVTVATPARVKSPFIRSASPATARGPISASTVTVQVPRRAVKRPAAEPVQNVSLVLEQLECHKKMVSSPDCMRGFKSVRDAIRRLVPYHTCNIPDIKEEYFDESERLFDKMADRIAVRSRAMVNKYHLLCLRDSTRDSCSAEMVMIERMFLQKEKAKLAEDKARIKADPAVIKEYFPRKRQRTKSDDDVIAIYSDDESNSTYRRHTKLTHSEPDNQSLDGDGREDLSMYVGSGGIESPLSNADYSGHSELVSQHRTYSSESYYSRDSFASPVQNRRMKAGDSSPPESSDEILLQEAVDSILL